MRLTTKIINRLHKFIKVHLLWKYSTKRKSGRGGEQRGETKDVIVLFKTFNETSRIHFKKLVALS